MLNIALAGPICSGKTTIAQAFVDVLGYRRLAFAGPLKSAIASKHGITVQQLDDDKATYRDELRAYGAAMREANPLHWCIELGKVYDMERWARRPFIIDDLRYHNEAEYLRERGFMIVAVHTPDVIRRRRHYDRYGTELPDDDESERQSKNIDADIIISGLNKPTNVMAEIIRRYGRILDGNA